MKRATVLLWLFMAYLFIACEAKTQEIEMDQESLYGFCFETDFINFRYCVEYLEVCWWDGEEMQWCQADYKSNLAWRESN